MSHEYCGRFTERVAFPLGGIGAGMIALEGRGCISQVSIRNRPDVGNEPCLFSAVCVKGETNVARVLEGPVPRWKTCGAADSANGCVGKTYGLPRLKNAGFSSRFPFATVRFDDDKLPLEVTLTGWSPFTPPDSDSSSFPFAALEYAFYNPTDSDIEAVYSFNSRNFMDAKSGKARVTGIPGGLVFDEPGLEDKPWLRGSFAAVVDDPNAVVNHAWFRGGWFDSLTLAWKDVAGGSVVSTPPITEGELAPGGSIFVRFKLRPSESKTIRLMFSWYVPESDLVAGSVLDEQKCGERCCGTQTYSPWYAGRFADIVEAAEYWRSQYDELRERSAEFSEAFFDTTLPSEVVDAVEANLSILKSPTVLRQTDGRLWCWEGCHDGYGCCHGSCTHVWNYAQALPHLFPDLERSLRQTEFHESQDERGHQNFRSSLPVRSTNHDYHAAADGQFGGILKVYRDWRICGDTRWLRGLWPEVKRSLDYCIYTWDPAGEGILREPHHNTYDIEFRGPDGMCTSFYLAALKAACVMGEALVEDTSRYSKLFDTGLEFLNTSLWNGDYFFQQVDFRGSSKGDPGDSGPDYGTPPEAMALLAKEGPKYQYGDGCLSDGVIGFWMAQVCGLDELGESDQVRSHLQSVYKHNFKHDLSEHVNPQRPSYALGDEGGLLLCTWPKGGRLTLPFPYSEEVFTGIEYRLRRT